MGISHGNAKILQYRALRKAATAGRRRCLTTATAAARRAVRPLPGRAAGRRAALAGRRRRPRRGRDGPPGRGAVGRGRSRRGRTRSRLPRPAAAAHATGRPGHRIGPGAAAGAAPGWVVRGRGSGSRAASSCRRGLVGAAGLAAGAAGAVILRPQPPAANGSGTTAAAWLSGEGTWVAVATRRRRCRPGARCASARRLRRLRRERRGRHPGAQLGVHPHGLHAPVPAVRGATCAARATAPAST